jgi:hypothetical protein
MNKQWFIKINTEDNLYYDSENREYKLRLFCPRCRKPSECQCYQHYEDYERDCITEFPVRCCSYLCCLIINSDSETENIIGAAKDIGIEVKQFTKYTEEEAKQIVDYLIDEGIWDFSDESSGEQCKK